MGYGKTYRTKWLEDLSGNQGTANQVLISTSAGIAWATASTIIGGPYLPLSGGTMTGTGKIRMPDNFQLQLGTSNDMEIYHDGTNSRLDNYNGDLYIKNNADDKDIIFQSDNGSGRFSTYFRVDGGAVETRFLKSTLHFDNIKAQFGDSADLQILHDGSNSYIADTGTGALFIDSSKTNFQINGSTVMNINFDSKVGIGTTNPDEKLRVDGNIKSAGDFIGAALKLGFAGSANITTNDTNEDLLINPNGSGDILMHTTSSGNVGIGTTGPSEKLDVQGNIKLRGTNNLTISSTSNGGNFSLSSGIRGFNFANNNGDLVRIDSSGNVGIGTTSPSAKLHLADSSDVYLTLESTSVDTTEEVAIKYNNYSTGANYWWQGLNQSEDWSLGYGTSFSGSTTRLLVDSTGNVGIGTTSPDYQLEVESTSSQATIGITGGNTDARLHLKTNNGNWMLQNDYSNNGALSFYNSGHRLVVSKDGNVGIGTTSPASKLEVNGTATVDGQLNINGDATSSIRIGTGGTNAALIYSLTGDTLSLGANNATNLVCKTNKDVEFRGNLDLISNNALVLDNANNNNQMYIRNGGSNAAAIQFGHGTVGGNIKMVLASDGKLGIGTTSPTEKLEVNGNVKTSGTLSVNGTNITVANAGNPYLYLNDTNGGAAIFQQSGNDTRIGSDSNTQVQLVQNNAVAVTISTSKNVGIGTTSPAASALLDVSSTTKGVLLPRMSTTQINAISSPAEGLTVYNTVLSTLCFFNGVSWQKVTSANM